MNPFAALMPLGDSLLKASFLPAIGLALSTTIVIPVVAQVQDVYTAGTTGDTNTPPELLSLPLFDPTKGTLESVELELFVQSDAPVQVTITNSGNVDITRWTVPGITEYIRLDASVADNPFIEVDTGPQNVEGFLLLVGETETQFGNPPESASLSQVYSSSDPFLTSFIGIGTFDLFPTISNAFELAEIEYDLGQCGEDCFPSAEVEEPFSQGAYSAEVRYNYALLPADPVPAPFPLIGAATAFGFCRKLRRRIKASA